MWLPLNINSVRAVERFFQGNEYPLSDYSLPSLLAWNSTDNKTFFELHDDVLVFAIKNKQRETNYLLLPLGLQHINAELLKDLAVSCECPRFRAVPETLLDENILVFFEHSEDEQNANYIYLANDLARLKGNRFVRKRNHINNFMKRLSLQQIVVEPITAITAKECLQCLHLWREEKIRQNTENGNTSFNKECEATTVALNTIGKIDWISLLVRVDDVVCAFAIGSKLTKDTVALNFEKALPYYRGLSQFLDREFARLVAPEYRYINKEGDMDIPNLRASKESYHPQNKLRSFSLLLRE